MLNSRHIALSDEHIRRFAPSVFAQSASTKQSDRYAFIPTINVIEGMRANNWDVVKASESRTRDILQRGYTKHMVRFTPRESNMTMVGDSRIEVVLINSHNGSSQYVLMSGIFVLVCSNGLVIADGEVDAIKVRHTGNAIEQVIDGSNRILQNAPRVNETIKEWKQIPLTVPEQNILARAAHSYRFDQDSPIKPEQLLAPKRYADNGSDLWSTFNRIQEHTVRGNDRARTADTRDERGRLIQRGRMVRSREVKSISDNVKLNQALWQMAEDMAKLKRA
jgi:hypothetical protein